jgi:dihydroxyacid dehydratase/phosphogluconate dehydratase
MSVHLNNGQNLTAYCPDSIDNWAQGTKRICHSSLEHDQQTINVETLLLQETPDGHYLVLQADLSRPAMPMTYARPANEHVFLELSHTQQSVFSADFLAVATVIFSALFGLKWLFEKYLLSKM